MRECPHCGYMWPTDSKGIDCCDESTYEYAHSPEGRKDPYSHILYPELGHDPTDSRGETTTETETRTTTTDHT